MTPLKKVLVANRGEIAVRVLAALRERRIPSVAVYSEADAEALHVRLADEAVCIGPAPAAESYLKQNALIDAARQVGADAVHPGYGFLAENADFAGLVEEAGLIFLGPHPETIALLGDKRRARAVADKVGVPVVPGWEGSADDLPAAHKAAASMGYPLLVKAALGGGGKGMTRVEREGDLDEALATAARLAASAFGDPAVYVEKAIIRPRHVEVQLLGDGEGDVVHLFERECSLQRRHQKVIEESPSPVLDEETRTRLTDAAVRIAREVNYRSAGTCEFLLGEDGDFYFLEVNARIQVEHGVTELVTGRDIVQSQLAIAEGRGLPFTQDEIRPRGAAVEARLYAEDPDTGFLPQAGDLLRVELPSGPWVRVDAGVATGDAISTHYDPMIAKVLASGSTRELAWRRLARALDQTVVHGPVTNLAFLRELCAHPRVLAGDFHTEALEEEFLPARSERLDAGGEDLLAVAAAIADRFGLASGGVASRAPGQAEGAHAAPADPFSTLPGWRHPGLDKGD